MLGFIRVFPWFLVILRIAGLHGSQAHIPFFDGQTGFALSNLALSGRNTTSPGGNSLPVKSIIARCEAKGVRLTGQRRLIAQVLEDAEDHPDVEELYARASVLDPHISLATTYRTVKLFEEEGILSRLEFGDGRARYEDASRAHHDHLIDLDTGEVIEFVDKEIEALQERIAAKLGYELRGHKLELFGIRKKSD